MILAALLTMNVVSVLTVLGAVSGVFLLLALLARETKETTKWVLFCGIALPALLATIFLVGSTIFLNTTSVTKGPVHWHADFVIFHCGQEVDLKNPRGLSNRIGTPLLHEHDDDRLHVEGVVTDLGDISLRSFFDVIGGELTPTSAAIPTNHSLLVLANGQQCPNGAISKLQIFVYSTKDGKTVQSKLQNYMDYVPSPETLVPPGDCIVIEFGPERARTDRICTTYRIAAQKGELTIE